VSDEEWRCRRERLAGDRWRERGKERERTRGGWWRMEKQKKRVENKHKVQEGRDLFKGTGTPPQPHGCFLGFLGSGHHKIKTHMLRRRTYAYKLKVDTYKRVKYTFFKSTWTASVDFLEWQTMSCPIMDEIGE
jgi:hypothetical protein